MTLTLAPINVKDAAATTTPMASYNDGTNNVPAHVLLDNTGAIISPATSGKQDTIITAVQAIQTSAASAATAAKQDTGNTSLGNMDTNLGAKADSAASTDTGTFSLIALFKRALQSLTLLVTAVQGATPAGSAIIGKVGIDQTTPGTTDSVTLATGQGAGATIGATADAVVAAGATGSLSAKLRRATQGLEDLKSLIVLAAGSNVVGKVGIDQTTPGTTNLVYLPAPLIVTGGTTTRPANTTAYVAGQLLANSTTAGSVTYPTIAAARANDQAGTILRLRLKKTGTTLTNGIFRVHLYNSQPTVTNGDGATWLTTTAGYVGAFDVTMTQAFSDSAMGIGVPSSGSGVAFAPATGTQNLYYLIEARAAYTPASAEVFTPYVEVQ